MTSRLGGERMRDRMVGALLGVVWFALASQVQSLSYAESSAWHTVAVSASVAALSAAAIWLVLRSGRIGANAALVVAVLWIVGLILRVVTLSGDSGSHFLSAEFILRSPRAILEVGGQAPFVAAIAISGLILACSRKSRAARGTDSEVDSLL